MTIIYSIQICIGKNHKGSECGGLIQSVGLFLPIRYPDQTRFPAKKWHFDCECLFVSDKKLYFLTKHRVAGQVNTIVTSD